MLKCLVRQVLAKQDQIKVQLIDNIEAVIARHREVITGLRGQD